MRIKTFSALIWVLMLAPILMVAVALPVRATDEWVHFVPISEDTRLKSSVQSDGTVLITVYMFIRHAGFNLTNRGSAVGDGGDFYADSEFWVWTGASAAVVLNTSWTYNLGQLTEGAYIFTFSGWGFPVKTLTFKIGFPSDVNKDLKVDTRDLATVALAYGSKLGDERWNAQVDVHQNAKIDIKDLAFVASDFGKLAPT